MQPEHYYYLIITGSASTGQGPGYDHTYGTETGHYMYANPNYAAGNDDLALLESVPFYSSQRSACYFPFVYNVSIFF